MNPYVGKICPYCKVGIEEKDSIVICSNCEMPHHKDCWIENEGCTTFGCVGTIQNLPLDAPEVFHGSSDEEDFDIDFYDNNGDFNESYCPNCGSVHNWQDKYCGHCGYEYSQIGETGIIKKSEPQVSCVTVNPTQLVNKTNTKNIAMTGNNQSVNSAHSFEMYVDSNIEYYVMKKELIERTGKVSFNWAAFFFDGFWCAYRKMYGPASVVVIIGAIAGWLEFGIAFIGIKLYLGFKGTKIYIDKISEYQNEELKLTETEKMGFFTKHKGKSILAPILLYVGLFVGYMAVYMFL